jgi:hypothetical protein
MLFPARSRPVPSIPIPFIQPQRLFPIHLTVPKSKDPVAPASTVRNMEKKERSDQCHADPSVALREPWCQVGPIYDTSAVPCSCCLSGAHHHHRQSKECGMM